ncbi:hypothetical protein HHK36_019864 [Tetracentron sinense]|uniref:F-box domain-containing protein n=1 Tax=Tetracentron sinense TaxID=13715 RepID=A0A834YUH9_TETSI|nr:hypothetical protein HHK36_019864 [Tetracentron sinense]
MVDRISDLPDEILTYTLSFLTLRDAAVTSVLSSRWRYLWTSVTSLNFDDPLCMRRHRYIKWVNQILQLHQGSNIGAFRVCFDFDKKSSHHVDRWIDFAIEKGVQSLELDMSKDPLNYCNLMRYTFPCNIFAQERRSYLKNLRLRLCILRPPVSGSFKYLRGLTLENVYVIGEVLENFLSNCLLLERLTVEEAHNLVNLKVAGPSLQLKYLVILFCFRVKNIEISAANLVSFKYYGSKTNLSLKNVPQLVDVYFGVAPLSVSDAINYGLRHLAGGNLSQLQTLMLGSALPFEANMGFKNLIVLTNLKHLLLLIYAKDHESLLGFTSLLKASPFLHRLELHLHWRPDAASTQVRLAFQDAASTQVMKIDLAIFFSCTRKYAMGLSDRVLMMELSDPHLFIHLHRRVSADYLIHHLNRRDNVPLKEGNA